MPALPFGDGAVPPVRHHPAGARGLLQIIDLQGTPSKWSVRDVSLAGFDGMFATSDPEPEFVDINAKDLAVVTLPENNHLAVGVYEIVDSLPVFVQVLPTDPDDPTRCTRRATRPRRRQHLGTGQGRGPGSHGRRRGVAVDRQRRVGRELR